MNLSKKTKPQLVYLIHKLLRDNVALREELDSITDRVVPFIAEYDVPKGHTVMVRVPKRFKVSES